MRLALVVSDLPTHATAGAGSHAAALADALTELGHQVEVFAPRELHGLVPLAQRREEHAGWAVTWVNVGGGSDLVGPPSAADLARAFGGFLDRERPEVVHFEGLRPVSSAAHGSRAALGVDVVEEAKRRGLATVYFAHDYELASESPLLLRPDLAPLTLGEREAEVRCALARRELATLEPDASVGGAVLLDELPSAARKTLQNILEGSYAGLGDLDEIRSEVKQSLEHKRAAFAALDARFASTRTVARRLSGALGRAVDLRPVGTRSAAPRAAADDGERRIRFAFVGEIDKPSGLHLLLDAFASLDGAADLAVHGDSSDRGYLRRCRERARELGVRWSGPIGPEGLEPLIAAADVVVVSALGEGGLALGARVASAGGLPVVAPRTEAISEFVQDDMNGLLFERGDVDSLVAALQRFVKEEWLLDRLQGGSRPPRAIRAEAEDWVETYAELVEIAARREARPRVAPAWRSFAERYHDLAARPDRELFAMVMQGLDGLGAQMGLKTGPREFLATAAGRGSRLRDGLVDDKRAIDWLTRSVGEHEEARRELDESVRVQEAKVEELRQQIGQLGEAVRGREQELQVVAAERDELRDSKEEVERARERLDAQLSEARTSLEALEQEREFLAKTLEEGDEELRLLRERIGGAEDSNLDDREALERHFESLQAELEGLRRHDEYLRRSMTELVENLGERLGADLKPPRSEPLGEDELRSALTQGRERLAKLVEELAWRRREMADARQAAQTLFSRIAGGSLASRVRAWKEDRSEESR